MNEKELDIINLMVEGWIKDNMRLYGYISYQDVIDFLNKIGATDAAKKVNESINDFEKWAESVLRKP